MSDPIDEVMKQVASKMKPAEDVTISSSKVSSKSSIKKEKLFNNKYYRTVNIDVTAEEKKALEVEAKFKAAVEQKKTDEAAAAKKKKDEEDKAAHQEALKKMLQGMGFEVK